MLQPPKNHPNQLLRFFICLLLFISVACWAGALGNHLVELGASASKIRELSYRPVTSKMVSQSECVRYTMRLLDKEMTPPRTERRETFLRLLGLISGPKSLKEQYAALLGDQVRGLYDPAAKCFLVVSGGKSNPESVAAAGLGLNMDDILTVHELGHAIQDQHFNLTRISAAVADNFDQEMAASSVFEGDATLLMLEFALQSMGMDPSMMRGQQLPLDGNQMMNSSPALASAPRYLREAMSFPYAEGYQFVSYLKNRGGWKTVDGAFANLPRSSAEILHPNKFNSGRFSANGPVWPALPAPSGWTVIGQDSAGEFTIRVWAREKGLGDQVATGWVADRYQTYRNGSNKGLVWDTAWEKESDAREFVELISRSFIGSSRQGGQNSEKWAGGSYSRNGNSVRLILNLPTPASSGGVDY